MKKNIVLEVNHEITKKKKHGKTFGEMNMTILSLMVEKNKKKLKKIRRRRN